MKSTLFCKLFNRFIFLLNSKNWNVLKLQIWLVLFPIYQNNLVLQPKINSFFILCYLSNNVTYLRQHCKLFSRTPHDCLSWGILSRTQLRDAQWLKFNLKSCIVDVLWLKYSVVLWLKYHHGPHWKFWLYPFRCSRDVNTIITTDRCGGDVVNYIC